jgi:hypothetical protein
MKHSIKYHMGVLDTIEKISNFIDVEQKNLLLDNSENPDIGLGKSIMLQKLIKNIEKQANELKKDIG